MLARYRCSVNHTEVLGKVCNWNIVCAGILSLVHSLSPLEGFLGRNPDVIDCRSCTQGTALPSGVGYGVEQEEDLSAPLCGPTLISRDWDRNDWYTKVKLG